MLVQSPLGTLEGLLNRQIDASTPARAALARLDNRRFAIAVTGAGAQPLLRLVLQGAREGVRLELGAGEADAEARGSPAALAGLLLARQQGAATAGGVLIQGDAGVVQGFEALFKAAPLDLEAELARLVGGRLARPLLEAARGVADHARRVARSLARSSGEYLVEEGRDVASAAELDGYCRAVDRLRDDVERLDARLALLSAGSGAQS